MDAGGAGADVERGGDLAVGWPSLSSSSTASSRAVRIGAVCRSRLVAPSPSRALDRLDGELDRRVETAGSPVAPSAAENADALSLRTAIERRVAVGRLGRRDRRPELLAQRLGGGKDLDRRAGLVTREHRAGDLLEHARDPPAVTEPAVDEQRARAASRRSPAPGAAPARRRSRARAATTRSPPGSRACARSTSACSSRSVASRARRGTARTRRGSPARWRRLEVAGRAGTPPARHCRTLLGGLAVARQPGHEPEVVLRGGDAVGVPELSPRSTGSARAARGRRRSGPARVRSSRAAAAPRRRRDGRRARRPARARCSGVRSRPRSRTAGTRPRPR